MNTIFTKSEKSDPHRLILNLSEKKTDIKRSD